MRSGRNDLSSRGNGKRDEERRVEAPRAREVADSSWRDQALRKLMAFHERRLFKAPFMLAIVAFMGEDTFDGTRSREERDHALDASQASFLSWFCFDFILDSGITISRRFLAEVALRLTERQRAHIERLSASRLGVYEVDEVDRDQGFRVVDLVTGETLDVRERTATHALSRFDLLVTRIVAFEDGVPEIEGGVLGYPARCKPDLVAFVARERERHPKLADPTAFAKDPGFGSGLTRIWLDSAAFPTVPGITPG